MARMLARCPLCEGQMAVTEVTCERCSAKVQSKFQACRFCRLSPTQSDLVELFLRSRGNISSLCEQLGISYPTAVKRLEAAINALGAPPGSEGESEPEPARQEQVQQDRTRILEMLDRGEITAEEATKRLQDL